MQIVVSYVVGELRKRYIERDSKSWPGVPIYIFLDD